MILLDFIHLALPRRNFKIAIFQEGIMTLYHKIQDFVAAFFRALTANKISVQKTIPMFLWLLSNALTCIMSQRSLLPKLV